MDGQPESPCSNCGSPLIEIQFEDDGGKQEFEILLGILAEELSLEHIANPWTAITTQKTGLRRLLAVASTSTGNVRFLALYDATMRNLEILLLSSSFGIGDSPHLVLKKVVKIFDPAFSIRQVVDRRHQIKKQGFKASIEDVAEAEKLLKLLSEKVFNWYFAD